MDQDESVRLTPGTQNTISVAGFILALLALAVGFYAVVAANEATGSDPDLPALRERIRALEGRIDALEAAPPPPAPADEAAADEAAADEAPAGDDAG